MKSKYTAPKPRNPAMNMTPTHPPTFTPTLERQHAHHAHHALVPPMDPPDGIPIDMDPKWIIDSGASMHITYDVRSFQTLDLNQLITLLTVTFGSNHHIQATGIGSVKFVLPIGHGKQSRTIILDNVLYMPQAVCNLFSVKKVAGP
jgi:hypothetical protein